MCVIAMLIGAVYSAQQFGTPPPPPAATLYDNSLLTENRKVSGSCGRFTYDIRVSKHYDSVGAGSSLTRIDGLKVMYGNQVIGIPSAVDGEIRSIDVLAISPVCNGGRSLYLNTFFEDESSIREATLAFEKSELVFYDLDQIADEEALIRNLR